MQIYTLKSWLTGYIRNKLSALNLQRTLTRPTIHSLVKSKKIQIVTPALVVKLLDSTQEKCPQHHFRPTLHTHCQGLNIQIKINNSQSGFSACPNQELPLSLTYSELAWLDWLDVLPGESVPTTASNLGFLILDITLSEKRI